VLSDSSLINLNNNNKNKFTCLIDDNGGGRRRVSIVIVVMVVDMVLDSDSEGVEVRNCAKFLSNSESHDFICH
jgi:hypothetical protein